MIQRILLCSLLTLSTVTAALAVDPVNANRKGVAIKGYDPVAYFTEGEPAKGREDLTHQWNGATWRFANEEHRGKFIASPEKYAPQYGGYCAWAVSQGDTAPIDPFAWDIVEGRLYLNYSAKIQKRWQADRTGFIEAADRMWPELLRGK